MSSLKKTHHYNKEWEPVCFCVIVEENCTSFICCASLTLPKTANLEKHFLTHHAKYKNSYSPGSETRRMKVENLKNK